MWDQRHDCFVFRRPALLLAEYVKMSSNGFSFGLPPSDHLGVPETASWWK
jgi:hypothetical protein